MEEEKEKQVNERGELTRAGDPDDVDELFDGAPALFEALVALHVSDHLLSIALSEAAVNLQNLLVDVSNQSRFLRSARLERVGAGRGE